MRYIKIHTHTQMDNKKGAQSRYYYIESKEVLKSLKKIEKKDVDGACRTRRFSRRGLFAVQILLTPKKENLQQKNVFFFLFLSLFHFEPTPSSVQVWDRIESGLENPSPFLFSRICGLAYIVYTDSIFPTLLKNEAIKSVRRERI